MKRNILIGVFLVVVVAFMIGITSKASNSGLLARASQPAPDFALKDLNGDTVRLSDLRGKAVVLNFWATWCPPCREEIPWFVELQKKYGDQGLQIVGVSMDEGGKGPVQQFAQEMGINYKVVMGDPNVAALYGGVEALPTTFYIGRDGKVITYVPGLISHYEVERNIKEALRTAPNSTQASVSEKPGISERAN